MATKRELDDTQADVTTKRLKLQAADVTANGIDQSQEEQERAVGITVFVSPDAPGFECVVKQRYTDFLVNEISKDGQVYHLTQLSPSKQTNGREHRDAEPDDARKGVAEEQSPAAAVNAPPANEVVQVGVSPATDGLELPSQDRAALTGIFGESVTSQILRLHASVLRHPHKKPRDHPIVRSDLITEKPKRTEAHVAVRRIFASKLQTETLQDEPGIISIRASPPKGPAGARGQHAESASQSNGGLAKGKLGWDELGGEYLHFTLYKENRDTMEALIFIAAQLKIPAKNFEFAGTKDRRGVTVQRVAVFRVRAERIASLNRMARGWRVGDFCYAKRGLELGELGGNEFVITLKECQFRGIEGGIADDAKLQHAKTIVQAATESLRNQGFLNYYGLQRFGTFSTGTHVTGMKMLQGDLEGAVNCILAYPEALLAENSDAQSREAKSKIPKDDVDRANTIHQWRAGKLSAGDVRDHMPRRFQAESAIMQYLSRKDRRTGQLIQANDWQGALMQIQRNLRLMYVHAYQSYVWNMMAGKRWELYGGKVVEGDLVVIGEKDNGMSSTKDDVDEDGEPIVRPEGEDSGPQESDFTRARPLTASDIATARFDIFDVVLPLPGFDVEYPSNEVGKFYEEFMGSEAGGRLDPHKMRRTWKDVSLSGGYRKMMARPLLPYGVEWEVKEYERDDDEMVETDLKKLLREDGKEEATNVGEDGNVSPEGSMEPEKKIAVIMRLQLGSSQYATMALRELTKGGARAYKPEYNTNR